MDRRPHNAGDPTGVGITKSTAGWRLRLAELAAAATCISALCALVVWWLDGVRGSLGPLIISAREPWRIVAVAVVCYAVALILTPRGDQSLPWARLLHRVERRSFLLAAAPAAAVLVFALEYGARVAGGADSFGYVSQAYLWLRGDLHIEQPLAAEAPWLFANDSFTPLGYTPGANHTAVPTYSPGLPMIMAAAAIACGACGPYYVTPLFDALMVLLTWALAYRLTRSGLTSGVAAMLMASAPALLFNVVVPMSDVATAALWIASLLLLTWPRAWHAAASGLVAGAAILVRPNLVVLAAAGLIAAELWPVERRPPVSKGQRAVAFLLGVVPAVAALAIINNSLYGSPLSSGYPRLARLFAAGHFPANLVLYSQWLVESQTALVFLALVPVLFQRARPAWLTVRHATPVVVFVALLSASYLFYLVFDAWWFLRFFLPGFPFLFVLVSASLIWLARLPPAFVGVPALAIVVGSVVGYSLQFVAVQRLSEIGSGENRYAAVAEYIDRELPANAAILGVQHTGTLAFYAGRLTLRYDRLPGQRLQSVLDWLTLKGYRPYIVLEDWEERNYRQTFSAGGDALSRLELPVLAETTPGIKVRIYDALAESNRALPPIVIQVIPPRSCPEPRGASWHTQ
jgi:hypothetical protein